MVRARRGGAGTVAVVPRPGTGVQRSAVRGLTDGRAGGGTTRWDPDCALARSPHVRPRDAGRAPRVLDGEPRRVGDPRRRGGDAARVGMGARPGPFVGPGGRGGGRGAGGDARLG